MAPWKIMLAEDDVDDQQLFIDFLKHRTDLTILPVKENGVDLYDSLELIENDSELPDLIILDQNMPKMNGLQTLQLLKSSQRYSSIKVGVYSTYTDQPLIDACLIAGACAVLSKPVSPQGYEEMMDRFMGSQM